MEIESRLDLDIFSLYHLEYNFHINEIKTITLSLYNSLEATKNILLSSIVIEETKKDLFKFFIKKAVEFLQRLIKHILKALYSFTIENTSSPSLRK